MNLENTIFNPLSQKEDSEMTADQIFKNDHRSDIAFDNEEWNTLKSKDIDLL